jgi:hypothetical protein
MPCAFKALGLNTAYMSAASGDCCACETPVVTEIPGSPGTDGAAGAAGVDGLSVFTLSTADATFADAVATVQVSVTSNAMFVIGQTIFGADPTGGTDHGTFELINKTGTTAIGLRYTAAPGDTAAPFTIGSGGQFTSVGATGALSAALPNALTDNSTGTASDTIAAGVGVTTLMFHINLVALTAAAANLMSSYVPGYAFKILQVDYVTTTLGVGAGATMSLNLEIAGTNVTGGVVNPTEANTTPLGNLVAGTAVTAANVGTAAQALEIEVAAGGTIFTAGQGTLLVKIQNMDSASAIASLADHINDLITAL